MKVNVKQLFSKITLIIYFSIQLITEVYAMHKNLIINNAKLKNVAKAKVILQNNFQNAFNSYIIFLLLKLNLIILHF